MLLEYVLGCRQWAPNNGRSPGPDGEVHSLLGCHQWVPNNGRPLGLDEGPRAFLDAANGPLHWHIGPSSIAHTDHGLFHWLRFVFWLPENGRRAYRDPGYGRYHTVQCIRELFLSCSGVRNWVGRRLWLSCHVEHVRIVIYIRRFEFLLVYVAWV